MAEKSSNRKILAFPVKYQVARWLEENWHRVVADCLTKPEVCTLCRDETGIDVTTAHLGRLARELLKQPWPVASQPSHDTVLALTQRIAKIEAEALVVRVAKLESRMDELFIAVSGNDDLHD